MKHERDLAKPIRFNVQCEGDAKQQIAMLENESDLVMQITQTSGDVIPVFGQQVKMPRKTIQFSGARANVTNKESITKDGVLQCEVIPKESFTLEILYLTEEEGRAEVCGLEEMSPETIEGGKFIPSL
ncbi:hypothetical protein D3C78_1572580 [compost metagenome]